MYSYMTYITSYQILFCCSHISRLQMATVSSEWTEKGLERKIMSRFTPCIFKVNDEKDSYLVKCSIYYNMVNITQK